jgi:hypothetical protein
MSGRLSDSALRDHAAILWLLLLLFILRVVGQVLVAFFDAGFLPPMARWYSGLLPYPWLLASQAVIILVYGKVCVDFTRGQGFFVRPRRRFGVALLAFGALYLGAMLARYGIRMSLYPGERWTGGSIPTFFHWVLAGFLLVLGRYHWRESRGPGQPGAHLGPVSAGMAVILALALVLAAGHALAPLPPPASELS